MQRSLAIGVVFAIFATGCLSTPLPLLTKEGRIIESSPAYCSRLSSSADSHAQEQLGFGIVMAIASGAGIIAGAAMGPDTSTDASWASKSRNTLVLGSSALVAIPATILLTRSRDANTASAKAGAAMGDGDDDAMKKCLAARADLINARSTLADIAQKDLSSRIETLQKTKEKTLEEIKKSEEEAKAAAASGDAAKSAEKTKDAEGAKEVVRGINVEMARTLLKK